MLPPVTKMEPVAIEQVRESFWDELRFLRNGSGLERLERKMAAFIFVLVWHFGQPIFISRGFSAKQRFFTAAALGALFDVAIFAITGTTVYGIVVN